MGPVSERVKIHKRVNVTALGLFESWLFSSGISMSGTMFGWPDLISLLAMEVGRLLMPHHKKLAKVNYSIKIRFN